MDREIPSLGLLLAFRETAACNGVSAAADRLGLTQSAVSRQIKALEIFLGVALFTRTKNRMQLTERGFSYLESIAPLLEGLSDATRSANGSRRNASTLNIATLSTFGAKWLAPRLGSFRNANPEIRLNLVTRSNLFDFGLDHLDGAIYFGSAAWPGTTSTFLFNEEVAAVAFPEIARQIHSAEQVSRSPLLQITSRPFAWREWFESAGAPNLEFKPDIQVETFAMGIAAVSAGLGVGILPLFFIEDELNAGSLEIVLGQKSQSSGAYYFVCPETKRSWPAVRRFSSWIKAAVEAP